MAGMFADEEKLIEGDDMLEDMVKSQRGVPLSLCINSVKISDPFRIFR